MPDSIDKVRKSPGRAAKASPAPPGSPKPPAVGSDSAGESEKAQFGDVLRGVTRGPAEKRLGAVLEDIRKLAAILARRRLLEDLEAYREKVGDFLRICMDEVLVVREAAGRKGLSRRKQLLVVKKVNFELEELSRMVLEGAGEFRILKELGTIEGLLMDLYR